MKKTQNTKSIKRKYPLTLDGNPAKNWRKLKRFDGFDFAGVSFEGIDLLEKDFTNAKNLTWRQINGAGFFYDIKLPSGMDFSGVSFKGKDICGIDFTKAKNLTARQIFEANYLEDVILPADIIPGFFLANKMITIKKRGYSSLSSSLRVIP